MFSATVVSVSDNGISSIPEPRKPAVRTYRASESSARLVAGVDHAHGVVPVHERGHDHAVDHDRVGGGLARGGTERHTDVRFELC
jgi:hypothetical protein